MLLTSITLNDLEHRKGDLYEVFRDFKSPRTFHWRIAAKRPQIDDNKLRTKLLALNADVSDVTVNLVGPRIPD
jgi:hypothetical protein